MEQDHMTALDHAALAIRAHDAGDHVAARVHVAEARRMCRAMSRRHRQVTEIAELVVQGRRDRAAGLALLHAAEFPTDATDLSPLLEVG
jgi:hypothetical protein